MKPNDISAAAVAQEASQPVPPIPPKHILVVDDDEDIRKINVLVLSRSGYQVDAAEDGAVGWQVLNSKNYDLLVTDQNMPNVSGMELLRKLHDASIALPVIMATGTLPREELTRFPWIQPVVVLLKPYTAEELLGTVKAILQSAQNISGFSVAVRAESREYADNAN